MGHIKIKEVAMLFPGRNFSQLFMQSWTNSMVYFYNKELRFTYTFYYSPLITECRNNLIGRSPYEKTNIKSYSLNPFDNKIKPDKVIFIDSDMVWDVEALEQLIFSPYDITVAPYVLTDKKRCSIKNNGDDFMPKEEIAKHKKPFEIEAAGMGFVSCNLEVLQKMEYPWFDTRQVIVQYEDGKKEPKTIGEDVYFFEKARRSGFKVYCDPRIKVGHEKFTVLTVD